MKETIKRVTVAYMLIAALVTGIALGFVIPGNVGTESAEAAGGVVCAERSAEGIGILSREIAEEDYAAYGVSSASLSALEVTAIAEPAGATGDLNWSVSWEDASSEWASGKSVESYVTVTGLDNMRARVECLREFGEPVVLRVEVATDSRIFATCGIDYVSACEFDYYLSQDIVGGASIVSNRGMLAIDRTGTKVSYIHCEADGYGVGTVQGAAEVVSVSAEFSEDCREFLSEYVTRAQAVCTGAATIGVAEGKTFFSGVRSMIVDEWSTGPSVEYDTSVRTKEVDLTWSDFFTVTGAEMSSIGTAASEILKDGILQMSKSGISEYATVRTAVAYTYGNYAKEYVLETAATKLDPGTFYIEFDGACYTGQNGVLTLPIRSGVRIDVNAQEYTVKVSPRVTEETEGMYYFKSGTATYFSEWGDLTKAFGITKHSGYFTVGDSVFNSLSSTSFWSYLSAQLFTGDKSGGNVAEKVDYHEIPCFWLEVTSGSETVRVALKLVTP